MPFICEPEEQRSNHTFIFKKASLIDPTLRFWWNHTLDDNDSELLGFMLSWHLENGSLPDVRQLVSRELSGSVSTPGLGSIPPPNYYKERHEYTAVIELPHNITDVIGVLGKLGPGKLGPGQLGPGQLGPGQLGPICHFLGADSWAPDNWAPGSFGICGDIFYGLSRLFVI